jgi:putative ABC transport system permease protein
MADHPKPGDWLTVIGVVDDMRVPGQRAGPADLQYYSLLAQMRGAPSLTLIARARGDEGALLRELARAVGAIDPTIRLRDAQTMRAALAEAIAGPRFNLALLTAFALLALVLSAVGLYGVVAFAVQQRTRDIAVHVAFGATGRDVLRLVLRREMRLVLAGLAVGLILSAGEARLLGAIVVPLHPLGAAGWVALPAFLLAVAGAAALAPARRALRIQPMRVLRSE